MFYIFECTVYKVYPSVRTVLLLSVIWILKNGAYKLIERVCNNHMGSHWTQWIIYNPPPPHTHTTPLSLAPKQLHSVSIDPIGRSTCPHLWGWFCQTSSRWRWNRTRIVHEDGAGRCLTRTCPWSGTCPLTLWYRTCGANIGVIVM